MVSLQHFAIVLLASAIAAGGCYLKGRSDGRALEMSKQASLNEVALVAREAAIAAAAENIARISVTHTTIRQKAEVITREKPVYRDCVNDPGVVRLLDSARANEQPESAGDRRVPEAGAGRSPDVR